MANHIKSALGKVTGKAEEEAKDIGTQTKELLLKSSTQLKVAGGILAGWTIGLLILGSTDFYRSGTVDPNTLAVAPLVFFGWLVVIVSSVGLQWLGTFLEGTVENRRSTNEHEKELRDQDLRLRETHFKETMDKVVELYPKVDKDSRNFLLGFIRSVNKLEVTLDDDFGETKADIQSRVATLLEMLAERDKIFAEKFAKVELEIGSITGLLDQFVGEQAAIRANVLRNTSNVANIGSTLTQILAQLETISEESEFQDEEEEDDEKDAMDEELKEAVDNIGKVFDLTITTDPHTPGAPQKLDGTISAPISDLMKKEEEEDEEEENGLLVDEDYNPDPSSQ